MSSFYPIFSFFVRPPVFGWCDFFPVRLSEQITQYNHDRCEFIRNNSQRVLEKRFFVCSKNWIDNFTIYCLHWIRLTNTIDNEWKKGFWFIFVVEWVKSRRYIKSDYLDAIVSSLFPVTDWKHVETENNFYRENHECKCIAIYQGISNNFTISFGNRAENKFEFLSPIVDPSSSPLLFLLVLLMLFIVVNKMVLWINFSCIHSTTHPLEKTEWMKNGVVGARTIHAI